MRLRTGGAWRKTLPHFKQANIWRKGEHVFSKVSGQWKDVSEPHKPASIIDLLIIPTHVFPIWFLTPPTGLLIPRLVGTLTPTVGVPNTRRF